MSSYRKIINQISIIKKALLSTKNILTKTEHAHLKTMLNSFIFQKQISNEDWKRKKEEAEFFFRKIYENHSSCSMKILSLLKDAADLNAAENNLEAWEKITKAWFYLGALKASSIFERNEAIYATYKETRGEGIKTKAKKIKFIKMLILEVPEGGWKSKKNAAEVLAIKMAEQNESLVKVKNRLVFWLSRDSTVSDAFYASKTVE